MRRDRDNPLALSSKKPCQSQADYGGELERLRADLEREKNRRQQAYRRLCVELRHLREESEREQQRAVRELTARRGCQKVRHWHLFAKLVNTRDSGQYSEIESTGKESFCMSSGETYTKLEQLLLMLYDKINCEQAVYKLHHRQELELEKAIFLCHLLEAHRKLLLRRQRAGHPSHISKSLTRKSTQEDSSNFCHTKPFLTCPRALLQRPHSASHSFGEKTKQDRLKQPLGKALCAADPCTTTAVVDTCQSSFLKICHPNGTPHAGWDNQPQYSPESSWSEESSSSKCMDGNMEVSYFILPSYTHGSYNKPHANPLLLNVT